MIYIQLFISFLKIGVLGFGGGMAIISLIQNEVTKYGWITDTEFVDIVAISQITPGPIGMNCATYVGYSAGGIWGSLIASVAIIIPSLVIMLTICRIYEKIRKKWSENRSLKITMRIIRIVVVILIASAAYRLVSPTTFLDYKSWAIFGIVFLLTAFPVFLSKDKKNGITDLISHPILLICLAGLAGFLIYS